MKISLSTAALKQIVVQTEAGILTPLLAVLKDGSELVTEQCVSYIMATLCEKDPKPDFSLLKPCLEAISRILKKDDDIVLMNSCSVLIGLFGSEVIDLTVYPRLVKLLTHSSVGVQN